MAVFQEPTQWDHELGNNADISSLPDDTSATTGVASLQKLFQIINQTPLEAGGVAPDREDFNALFKYLGDQIFYTQNGGVPSYNADYDYIAGRVVLYNGNLYKCIQANGASSTVVAPDSDDTYWQQLDKPSSALLPNQLVISPVPMTEANLHLLDGALLSGSGAYADYVTMMSELYTADPTATCWTDEATWQSTVSTYGECGKFVYDSVNNTLRLPKLKSFVQATTTASELGTLVEAGAPDIQGQLFSFFSADPSAGLNAGAFTNKTRLSSSVASSSGLGDYNLDFRASASNSTYGNSTTIQPQAIKYYFYIVVGTISKTDIQIDIDNVMTDLALKADRDLSNISAVGEAKFTNRALVDLSNVTAPVQAFKNQVLEWNAPDWASKIAQTVGVSYTASVNGFVTVANFSNYLADITINGTAYRYQVGNSGDNYVGASCFIPLNKGDTYSVNAGSEYFYFIPCKGAN